MACFRPGTGTCGTVLVEDFMTYVLGHHLYTHLQLAVMSIVRLSSSDITVVLACSVSVCFGVTTLTKY